jgi:AraC family transcriptional regulator
MTNTVAKRMRVSRYVEPSGPRLILSSRDNTRWHGFSLQVASVPSSYESFATPFDRYWMSVIVSGHNSAHLRTGREDRVVTFSPGSFCGYPAGQHWDHVHWDGQPVESISISIDLNQLKFVDVLFEQRPRLEATFCSSTDPGIIGIVASMRHELETGCLSGRVFAESLSLALAMRIDALGGGNADIHVQGRHRLSAASARRITDYIETFLGNEISIGDLAGLLQLSASRFAFCFRNTFGVPVHRYILSRRIARSVVMLRTQRTEIVEIAQSCGFASQSHFTETFRRFLGITPRRYRDREE